MLEKEHILQLFKDAKEAIKKDDIITLRELSNKTVHTSSISQDPDNIAIAVIIYSISKILERKDYRMKPGWDKFYKNLLLEIDLLIDSLENNDEKKVSKSLGNLRIKLGNVSGNLKKYIQEVFRQASINKASRIYEHGISLEKTAKLLGVSLWELSNYAGQTGIGDVKLGKTLGVKERIKLVEEMFS
ncbi:hypothetical protein HOD88_01350 [archaeon]|jgi:hypothetical protein|nr:hypothetical protein [archaeon]